MSDTTHADAMPEDNGTNDTTRRVGRRKMILGVAAAGVGASVIAGAEPAGAASPDAAAKDVVLSKANKATATTSISMAVEGDSAVKGIDTSTGGGGYGVSGTSDNGTGVYAASTGFNAAVYADATGEGSSGVYGISSGESGYGVYGDAAGSGGTGVYGNSAQGSGVYGNSTGENAPAVYGTSSAEGGSGVYGHTTGEDGIGLAGNAIGTGTGSYGVYAYSESAESLYVDGSAAVTGSLSKGGGSFKIDHPADPANKYLFHSFVESPDMKNVYDGTVLLDGKGLATVNLPDWFEALNRDYRYQLTAIGSPAPELHISRKVEDGEFSIAGGKANQEVSWQVTGIRQDAWANANRIPVEVEKPEQDRGRYLHPELVDGGEAITSLARAREHSRRAGRYQHQD